MTDGARQRSSTAGSSRDAAEGTQSGGGVALKKEIGLVSACGIIVGKCAKVRYIHGPVPQSATRVCVCVAEFRVADEVPPGVRVTLQKPVDVLG